MNAASKKFRIKPTQLFTLMSEKGTNNIRKIYFFFCDLEFCSLEIEDGEVIVTRYDFRDHNAILEAGRQDGLVEHTTFGGGTPLSDK